MSEGFIDKLLSGKYPRLESVWQARFEKLVDEIFAGIDLREDEPAGLDDEFNQSAVEADLNTEIEALRADLKRLESVLAEERTRHESAKRELASVRAELKAARYQLGMVKAALSGNRHEEPFG